MKPHVEHIERTSLISRLWITMLSSISASLLICLYKIFTRPYIDYICTALTSINKTWRQKLELILNHCLRCARRAVDSTCISNNELSSHCKIVGIEQRILTLADCRWKKASKNNDNIITFMYPHQSNNKKTLLNIIKGDRFF